MSMTGSERWLIYRSDEGVQRAARILEREDERYWVEVDGDMVAVDKVRGRQREVRPDTLDLLSVVDPGALTQRFATDPAGIVAHLLADHSPRELSKDDIVGYLGRFRLDADGDAWKQLQPLLKRHPHIEPLTRPPRYRWSEEAREVAVGGGPAPVRVPDTVALLSQLFSPRTKEARRGEALARLADQAKAGTLTPAQVVLVRAAGASTLPAPPWESVVLDGLDAGLAERVVDAASGARAFDWLRAVALSPASPELASHAADLLQTATDAVRADQAMKALDGVAASVRSGGAPGALDRVVAGLAAVDRLLDGVTDARVTARALDLSATVPTDGGRAASPLARWSVAVVALVAGDADRMAGVLDASGLAPETIEALGRVPDDGFSSPSVRRAWLVALARYDGGRAILAESTTWWQGLTLEALEDLGRDEPLAAVLAGPQVQRRVVAHAIEGSLEVDPATAVPAVFSLPPAMLQVVDGAQLAAAADRVDPATPLGRALAALRGRPA